MEINRLHLSSALSFIFIVMVAVAATGNSLASADQEQGSSSSNQAKQPSPVIKVTSRLVLVDVVAVDAKGRPVADLKQDDFTILEDGKEQHISVFNLQKQQALSGAGLTPVSANKTALPPNVVSNVRQFNKDVPLNVLLLDSLNTRMNNQQFVKSQLLKFLEKVPANQPLAIYVLGARLHLLQDFTSDPEVLKNVITHLKEQASPVMENAAGGPPRFWFDGIPLSPQVKKQALEFQQETESNESDQQVAITISALHSIAHSLSGYPGRKRLIWVSENIPLNIIPNKVPTGESAEVARRNFDRAVADVSNLLADAQIAVYPVDARGLISNDLYNVATQYDVRGDKMGSRGAQGFRVMDDTSDELMAAHSSMNSMAEYTGGQAFYNRNDLDSAIEQSIDDGSTYYALAYSPQDKSWNGHFRKIVVRVQRSGVKLRYRLGYFAVDPEGYAKENPKQRDAEFNTALGPDVPSATALSFVAGVLPPSIKTENKTVVNFAMDPQTVSFTNDDKGNKHAAVQCVVRAFSVHKPDQPLLTEAEDINANLPPDSYSKVQQRGLPCSTTLDIPPGEYLLRLAVRDTRSGLIGTANLQITVPKEGADKSVMTK